MLYLYIFDKAFRAKYAPNDFLVMMSDTGDEHPATKEHIEKTKNICSNHSIEFTHITPDMGYHADSWQSLRGFYRKHRCVGSKAFPKTCTDRLKIQPIYRFLEDCLSIKYGVVTGRKKGFVDFANSYGKIRMIVGISAGEETRIADPCREGRLWKRESIEMSYPLVELGLDRKGCQELIRSFKQPVPSPSNCVLCPFMSEIELLWLYRFMPNDFEEWVELESNKVKANVHWGERNLGVWGKTLLPDILVRAREKHRNLTDHDLKSYKFSHGHCVMSKY